MKKISAERESFKLRLQQSLRSAQYSSTSPTQLARNFNVRYAGAPVTVHAVRKWLLGESIPTQDKMRALADWLMVPIAWLRFGVGEQADGAPNPTPAAPIPTIELQLIASVRKLDVHQQQIIREIVDIFIRVGRQSPRIEEPLARIA